MARTKQTKGGCGYCGREFTKGGMLRHLQACSRRAEIVAESPGRRGKTSSLTHLRVSASRIGDFWMDLEMTGSATLQDLDQYLRAIWLECCGHLSMFSTGGWAEEDQLSLNTRIDQVFQSSIQIVHVYDFGTSSETLVRAVAVRDGRPTTSRPVSLMARNNPPDLICMECDQLASGICIECEIEDLADGLLCDQHGETHPHRDYGDPMPVVNSPRMGMCGYDGPAEPPY